jgi:CO/xanthine dehydrogenase FAD-binding subunit
MITTYSRPHTLEEALKLLQQPDSFPMGGGTWLNQPRDDKFAVVDLQALGFDKIRKLGNNLEIGACVTLQQLLESVDCPDALKQALRLEAGLNIRNAATVAGVLVTCDGRSAYATVMLALYAKLIVTNEHSSVTIGLGEFLLIRQAGLIKAITIPINVRSAFETVARSPLDRPIVCAAIAQWSSGRTRLALGGCHKSPALAMDGTEPDGIEIAARSSFQEAGDEWASSEYRSDVAATLAKRCLSSVIE